MKKKSYQLRILYSVKISLSNEGEIKVLSDEGKLEECVTQYIDIYFEWLNKVL